jgi:hypothetical protein
MASSPPELAPHELLCYVGAVLTNQNLFDHQLNVMRNFTGRPRDQLATRAATE